MSGLVNLNLNFKMVRIMFIILYLSKKLDIGYRSNRIH